jgi:hypothetical protein
VSILHEKAQIENKRLGLLFIKQVSAAEYFSLFPQAKAASFPTPPK